jgi:hypothetical protein
MNSCGFRMRTICVLVLLFASAILYGQSDRGSITGTVSDASGGRVGNVKVVATRTETGAVSETVTTPTGNYTLPSLAAGTYRLSFEAPGFAKSVQDNILVQTVAVLKIDAVLEVGTASQTIEVTSAAPMLQEESASLSNTLTLDQVHSIPLNYAGQGLENPTAFASTQPGATAIINTSGNYQVRVNGEPLNTYKTLVDGQDITSGIDPTHLSEGTPSQEALQEVTLQASNFAAEFGQVSGGLFNFTTKSGTNNFHGSVYWHYVNEIFNGGTQFSNNGSGGTVRPRDRAQNYGFTVGGPVSIPKLYDGRNRTFFFLNYERFSTTSTLSGQVATLPNQAFRNGDFSGALTGRQLGTDPLGRPIMENEIYDPMTTRTVNGQVVRDPFPGNKVDPSRIDPVAAKIQALIPNPTNSTAVINNYLQNDFLITDSAVPSVKVDQNFGAKTKVSFYWGQFRNSVPKNYGDGLPYPISSSRTYSTRTNTYRASVDEVFTPTLLLHFGVGDLRYLHSDSSPNSVLNYDAVANLGLIGASVSPAPFPGLTGLLSPSGAGVSYVTTPNGTPTSNLGLHNSGFYTNDNPTVVASLTWVKGNHTFKTGVEWREAIWTDLERVSTGGQYTFASSETGLPYIQSATLGGGDVGFPYASFLLGQVDSAYVTNAQEPNLRKFGYGIYVQDTWKVTPKLTLDYGIRYDYQQAFRESHDRLAELAPSVSNPSAGGLLGATQYQGYGPGDCNCQFTNTYPYALGPRLGVAYQLDQKTVIRAGWGLIYGSTPGTQYISGTQIIGVGWNRVDFTPSSFGQAPTTLKKGLVYNPAQLTNNSRNPGIRPDPGQINTPPYYIDPQAGRPARTQQYNIAIERQLTSKTTVEAAYVGNRSVWLQSNMLDVNANTAARFSAKGLDITNPAAQTLLLSPMNSALVIANGFTAPYAGFPMNLTLAQALRPYPQFGNITAQWSPRGNSWYDALQIKFVQHVTRGLEAAVGYTYQKELNLGGIALGGGTYAPSLTNDVFNRPANKTISSESQPQILNLTFSYVTPAYGARRLLRELTGGWTIGGFARYASGYPIPAPYAQNNLNSLLLRNTTGVAYFNRVPGVPLYLKDLNCHCFNPQTQLVLNPAAWVNPAAGHFGGSMYYNDYRYQRRPTESLNLGKSFVLPESMSLEVRMSFFNVFNRTQQADPTYNNALAATTTGSNGLTGGFGYINTGTLYGQPRQGQISIRFQF